MIAPSQRRKILSKCADDLVCGAGSLVVLPAVLALAVHSNGSMLALGTELTAAGRSGTAAATVQIWYVEQRSDSDYLILAGGPQSAWKSTSKPTADDGRDRDTRNLQTVKQCFSECHNDDVTVVRFPPLRLAFPPPLHLSLSCPPARD